MFGELKHDHVRRGIILRSMILIKEPLIYCQSQILERFLELGIHTGMNEWLIPFLGTTLFQFSMEMYALNVAAK